MTYGELFKADADPKGVIRELVRIKTKLRVARVIAEDFRENTSLGTIIREYEAREKELDKMMEEWT